MLELTDECIACLLFTRRQEGTLEKQSKTASGKNSWLSTRLELVSQWRLPLLLFGHRVDFCQCSQSVNVALHASRHTNTDHGPDYCDKCCMKLSHIYEIAIDR
jgi:hypothetical protein